MEGDRKRLAAGLFATETTESQGGGVTITRLQSLVAYCGVVRIPAARAQALCSIHHDSVKVQVPGLALVVYDYRKVVLAAAREVARKEYLKEGLLKHGERKPVLVPVSVNRQTGNVRIECAADGFLTIFVRDPQPAEAGRSYRNDQISFELIDSELRVVDVDVTNTNSLLRVIEVPNVIVEKSQSQRDASGKATHEANRQAQEAEHKRRKLAKQLRQNDNRAKRAVENRARSLRKGSGKGQNSGTNGNR